MYPRPQRCLQDYRKRAGCSNRGYATVRRARGQQPDVGGDDGHPYARVWPESTWECWLLEVCTLAGACQMPAHTPCSLCAARVPGALHPTACSEAQWPRCTRVLYLHTVVMGVLLLCWLPFSYSLQGICPKTCQVRTCSTSSFSGLATAKLLQQLA